MKKVIANSTIVAAMLLFFLSSCTKKDTNPSPASTTDSVKLEFYHVANGEGMNIGNQWYRNANGDSFIVTKFQYYISNIVLHGTSGTADYTEANSYHLVVAPGNSIDAYSFDLKNVPEGKYSGITFMIGVDSARNCSGAQTGALDPLNGMFWKWNTGYIMLKFEGKSPQSNQPDSTLEFHIGGFTPPNSVMRTVSLNFPNTISPSKYSEPHVHLTADVAALFASPNKISFASESTMMDPGLSASQIADNYANMFTITYAGQ